jgi:hypothetical protein
MTDHTIAVGKHLCRIKRRIEEADGGCPVRVFAPDLAPEEICPECRTDAEDILRDISQ